MIETTPRATRWRLYVFGAIGGLLLITCWLWGYLLLSWVLSALGSWLS